jgi:DNA invertase Pin-like site-specific DNA recombinase
LQHNQKNDAVLLIAKLDRLTRNVAFLVGLMESKVDFIACDNPHANAFTIQILAVVAENDAKQTSERTKGALRAKVKRDGEWRNTSGFTRENAKLGAKSTFRAAVDAHSILLVEKIQSLREIGLSYPKIAVELNLRGETTRQGKDFKPMTVKRILDRATNKKKWYEI